MTLHDSDPPATQSFPDLASLPVTLCIEVGRFASALEIIDQWRIGTLIPLDGLPGQVDLIVHQTLIGTGRMVLIDGAPGVEITTLTPAYDTRSPLTDDFRGDDVSA